MLLKKIGDELALGEEKVMIGVISVNFHAKELSGRAQITKFEVIGQFFNYRVNFGFVFASKGDIVNKDRHYDPDIVPEVNVHSMV